MNNKISKEILKYCDVADLHQFIIEYAAKIPEFEKAFMDRFNPKQVSSESKDDYVFAIESAFGDNHLKSGNRYDDWDDFGFDGAGVAADLQPLLDKATYYQQNKNIAEAMLICEALIETIPDEWDTDMDYEGDVQAIYDSAIDKLQKLLAENLLSRTQKEELFEWFSNEVRKTTKHEYVGLNNNIKSLEEYFTDTPEMLEKNLANMEERISTGPEYEKEDSAISKIHLLQKAGKETEAENATAQYIRFPNVRKLRLEKLIKEKQYAEAIKLIQEGIKIAIEEGHSGTVNSWKEELLSIYKLQGNHDEILAMAEELFYSDSNGSRKYYDELKKYTPEKDWPATLERLLSKMDIGYLGFNTLKADMLIEHKMWDRLFALCEKSGAEKLEKYEKYLKPLYAKEIFDAYQKYVEKQALITDQNAYDNVGRVLKKMKGYEGGGMIVMMLVGKYREVYKRRKNMMKVLGGV